MNKNKKHWQELPSQASTNELTHVAVDKKKDHDDRLDALFYCTVAGALGELIAANYRDKKEHK